MARSYRSYIGMSRNSFNCNVVNFCPRANVGVARIARLDGGDYGAYIWRSRLRYWIASAICDASMFSAPAKSAMVRPTFKTRL
jgi:hypothetical protein